MVVSDMVSRLLVVDDGEERIVVDVKHGGPPAGQICNYGRLRAQDSATAADGRLLSSSRPSPSPHRLMR